MDEEVGFDSSDIVEALKSIKYHEGRRTTGLKSRSRVFGYSPRVTVRQDYCHLTSLAHESPKEHDVICDYARQVVALYAGESPEVYEKHEEAANERVDGEWKIPGTPFTSGIINKNNKLKYHFDSGNFKDVNSCMLAFKHNVRGGYLALPEYDLGLEIANNSVTIFDGQSILHGVTPFYELAPDAYRYTVVYYSLDQMWKCLPLGEEVARIQNIKSARERARARGERLENAEQKLGIRQKK